MKEKISLLEGSRLKKIQEYFKESPEILSFILFLLGAVCVIFFTNNLMGIFAPFIISYVVTMITRPLMEKLTTKLKVPRLLATIICMLLIVVVGGIVIWFFVHNIVDGITYVINLISDKFTTQNILSYVNLLEEKLEAFSAFSNLEIDIVTITNEFYGLVKGLVSSLSSMSINIAMGIPSFLVAFIIGCIASFYMLYDYPRISGFLTRQFSEKTAAVVHLFNNNVLFSLVKMIFSYAILSVICFCELAIGFFILGIDDAWFIAFIISIIDVFPILGSGGVLVPWSIIGFLSGNPVVGIGMLVLWGVIVVVRQILEPKVVGSQIGLHPLITIMTLFIGLKTMGGLGLLMGPLYVIVCKKLTESGIIRFYKE